ncbi:MAG: AmmeMemoRadiSam system protein B [Anaerolineales bacterium]|nr:AmmeMemoRadiSam system protein B [Anaerolineales bacterium]
MSMNHPKLRPIQPEPIFYQGQHYFLLRDPLRLKENVMLLPDALLPLLFLCDGTRDEETILLQIKDHFEIELGVEVLDHFLNAFDEMCLLENATAARARQQLIDEYRAAPFRPPASAGYSYPDDPAELHHLLQNYLEEADAEPDPTPGKGLLSPHIDYPRGGTVYAEVWKRAANMIQAADLFIVLGTDHNGGHNPITLTRQNYATPYGILPTEQTVVDALVEVLGEEKAFAGELYHRSEHSLELVLTWLHHLRGGEPVPVVPILVGWLTTPHRTNGNTPLNEPLIQGLVDAVHRATRGRKVCYIISGDLAHVGPAFSGQPLDDAAKNAIRLADDDLFRILAKGDTRTFINKLLTDYEPNNVCGTFPAYLALRMMGDVKGEQVGYAQCPADEEGTSIVSVGGVVFR